MNQGPTARGRRRTLKRIRIVVTVAGFGAWMLTGMIAGGLDEGWVGLMITGTPVFAVYWTLVRTVVLSTVVGVVLIGLLVVSQFTVAAALDTESSTAGLAFLWLFFIGTPTALSAVAFGRRLGLID